MSLTTFFTRLALLGLAGSVLLLAHYGYGFIAAVLVMIPPLLLWNSEGRGASGMVAATPQAVMGLAVVLLISLSRPPVGSPVFPVISQVALAAAYGTWMIAYGKLRELPAVRLLMAGAIQFAGVAAAFLAAAYWHWPDLLVIAAVWAVSYAAAWCYLEERRERASRILAATWALVVGEISWVLQIWQVNYIIPKDRGFLIIPQIALITLGLGYCMASIYMTHSRKQLSRRRLIEYVAIAALLLTIVVAGTQWNGVS